MEMAQPVQMANPAAGAPVIAAAMPVTSAVPIKYGIGGNFDALANVSMLEFRQGNVLWEWVSGGCAQNFYLVSDRSTGNAIFLAEEESSCWCRCCCGGGAQPAFVKFFNATYGGMRQPVACCGTECVPEKKMWLKANGDAEQAVLTLEKPGCGTNYANTPCGNCFVCMACCQSEAIIHRGDVPTTPAHKCTGGPCPGYISHYEFPQGGPGEYQNKNAVIGHARVPMGGGGCKPTVEIKAMAPGQNFEAGQTFMWLEGPTFFGGFLDLCCPTTFYLSSTQGKPIGAEVAGGGAGDVAKIIKKPPEGGCALCIQMCTPADTYHVDLAAGNTLTVDQKAILMAELVHLDFLFFENEQPLCRHDEESGCCYILLCTCYCYGFLCPVQLCIPTKNNGGGQ